MIIDLHYKQYPSRTWKYLFPCIEYYGNALVKPINNLFINAVSIGYCNIDITSPTIFIAVAPNNSRNYSSSIKEIQNHSCYVKRHFYVTNMDEIEIHEISLPEYHTNTYYNFIHSKYSKMYLKKDVLRYFTGSEFRNSMKILLKQDIALDYATRLYNKEFNVKFDSNYYKHNSEYDLPLKCNTEIIDYIGDKIYIQGELQEKPETIKRI